MERRKLTKQDIDKVRHIEGFPIAKDEDIVALSDPPYYTACPNPFIEDFINEHGKPYDEKTDDYHREPFAADVSEGKNDPIYNAHSYHTKVPHKAIMRYILHYTDPGDIVLDGFCGTGMTGVAAQMCGSPDPDFKRKIDEEMPYVTWGTRKAILSDLSPAATFIAYNYNTPVDVHAFQKEAKRILRECEDELGWMYETQHVINGEVEKDITGQPVVGRINYTVWSDVFICPTCGEELIFWDVAVDKQQGMVHDIFACLCCHSSLKKRDCQRATVNRFDLGIKDVVSAARYVPVLINYSVGKSRFEKKPDEHDLLINKRILDTPDPYWYPTIPLPEGDKTPEPIRLGITHSHQFYTERNLSVLSLLNHKSLGSRFKIVLQSINATLSSKNVRYNMGKRGNGPVSGTLYIPSMIAEANIFKLLEGKIKNFLQVFKAIEEFGDARISLSSASDLSVVPDSSIDYIFTDPPFGANLNYSELSFLWEAWLRILTNTFSEAIVSKAQGKSLAEYQGIMNRSFIEFYRVLKPGRWMTVEFHNSKNSVWNAIQESLQKAGFIVADVRTIDKKQGSFNQVSFGSAVKQDLIISAYKPCHVVTCCQVSFASYFIFLSSCCFKGVFKGFAETVPGIGHSVIRGFSDNHLPQVNGPPRALLSCNANHEVCVSMGLAQMAQTWSVIKTLGNALNIVISFSACSLLVLLLSCLPHVYVIGHHAPDKTG